MRHLSTKFCFFLAGAMVLGGLVVSGAVAAPGDPPPGSITHGSNPHNLSSNATHGGIRAAAPPDGTDQICVFCHTPHGASADGPLWNRAAPTSSFPLYSRDLAIKDSYSTGVKADAKYYAQGEAGAPSGHLYPNGASRLCMSCHDGVTAINILRSGDSIAMVANPGLLDPDGSLKGSPGSLDAIGSVVDLSTAHPISFVYVPPTGDPNAIVNKINNAYGSEKYQTPSDPNVDTPLDGEGRMQCTTCHDPHIDNRLIAGLPFWRQAVERAGFDPYADVCNNCHKDAAVSPLIPPVHPIP